MLGTWLAWPVCCVGASDAVRVQVDDLVDIMQELLLHTDFNQPQMVAAIVREAVASKESALVSSGNAVVGSHLSSLLSMSGWTNAQMGGVPQLLVRSPAVAGCDTRWHSDGVSFAMGCVCTAIRCCESC